MLESINDWVYRLSSKPLPVMRQTLTRVNELLKNTHASLTKLSEVVGLDPGFSLYLFQYLNDLPKRPREPICKIPNVISILGMIAVEQAVAQIPVLEERLKGASRLGLIDCYSRAAHATVYAAGLAKRLGQQDPQTFITAALLHDVGEMALWVQAPDVMRGIHSRITQGAGREDAALEVLGFSFEELNQQLGSRWRLPALVQDSQGLFNSYQPQPLTVMLACAIARASAKGWGNPELMEYLELLADFLNIPEDKAQALLHQYAAQAGRQLYRLPLPLSVHRLLQLPAENKTAANPQAVKPTKTTAGAVSPPHLSATRPTPLSTQPSPAETAVKTDKQANPLHLQLTRTIDEMQNAHGLDNVMFAMLSPDKRCLKARYVASASQNDRLRSFETRLDQPGLFSIIMQKPQALWCNAANRERYLPMIPPQAIQTLCDKGFLIMSIFFRNKPIGMFYADNTEAANDLTADQFNNFKVSCQRFVQRLG
jgi:HD-like signal output (HDOD) protein